MVFTFATSQDDKSWLNLTAPWNISDIFSTSDTFQDRRGWLNAVALRNMPCMSTTLDTSHEDKFWLKDVARQNICVMLTTDETFQDDKSWLKKAASRNIPLMSIIAETSQEPIGPCSQSSACPELWKHCLIPSCNSSLDLALKPTSSVDMCQGEVKITIVFILTCPYNSQTKHTNQTKQE